MTYKLKATTEFWENFNDAADYITVTLQNPIAAERLLDELVEKAQALTVFPKASKPYASPPEVDLDYYALGIKNYLAFYVVVGDTVEFRRFLYSRSVFRGKLI